MLPELFSFCGEKKEGGHCPAQGQICSLSIAERVLVGDSIRYALGLSLEVCTSPRSLAMGPGFAGHSGEVLRSVADYGGGNRFPREDPRKV